MKIVREILIYSGDNNLQRRFPKFVSEPQGWGGTLIALHDTVSECAL
jgi:hypothetical protein